MKKSKYGEDFLEWEIYTEQCTEEDKEYKRGEQNWNILIGGQDNTDEYFACVGGIGIWSEKKAFCIHVNY